MIAAVTADIVGSRSLPDRASAQRRLEAAIDRVAEALPVAVRPMRATVGDELQGVYPHLRAALATTLLVRLALPDDVDVRFGIGLGEIEDIPSQGGDLSEGPAWWAARAAIEKVEELARREFRQARTWVVQAAEEGDATADAGAPDLVRIANAGLLTRDRIVGRWSGRVRRLVYGRIMGTLQAELAEAEGITQSAVSQTLSTAGAAAVIAGYRELVDPA